MATRLRTFGPLTGHPIYGLLGCVQEVRGQEAFEYFLSSLPQRLNELGEFQQELEELLEPHLPHYGYFGESNDGYGVWFNVQNFFIDLNNGRIPILQNLPDGYVGLAASLEETWSLYWVNPKKKIQIHKV